MKKIYILHGWAYDTLKWQPFLDKLKSNGIEPIILKIPGLTDKIDKPWTVDDYVNWLDGKLDKENKVILLGHSNGGKIALTFAFKFPNKIDKLFLIDSAGIYHNDTLIRFKRAIFTKLAKAGKRITKSEFLKNILYKFAGENDYNQANEIMKKTMQNLIKFDLTPMLTYIKTKTIIIWGKEDKITPIGDAYIFDKLLPNSNLFVINNARHSPQFTNVDEVSKIINEHI
jgi:pimeloyl-ACP methyl ester carboxylesterase